MVDSGISMKRGSTPDYRVSVQLNHKQENKMGRPVGSKNKPKVHSKKRMTHQPKKYKVCADTAYFHRVGHGLTQTEYAAKVGLSLRTIQRMETEPNFLTTRNTAYKIADDIIKNPPPINTETLILMDTWNKESNAK